MTKSVSNVPGVKAASTRSGIKTYTEGHDLGIIFVPDACGSAGVFTTNRFRAPSVEVTERSVKDGVTFKAVVANSGNANAGTGEEGVRANQELRQAVADKLGIKPEEVAIASTGRISSPFPLTKALDAVKAMDLESGEDNFAEAIMTTDTCEKISFIEEDKFSICGVCKGSGMIAPNMATMLMFAVTDARFDNSILQELLVEVVDKTLNMLSVDTDTSTNDMVVLLSSGESEVSIDEFRSGLETVFIELTEKIAKDGEGATKLVRVICKNASSLESARSVAKSVVDSPLVKTAIYGEDPNWGRILMAAGKAPKATFDPEKIDLYLNGVQLLKAGAPGNLKREEIKPVMEQAEINIELVLNEGSSEAVAWGCDLTHKYVDINVAYT